MEARTLVVGDIHGAYIALIQALERAKVSPEDHFIFLGDYVDGWSQSFEVVDFLLDFKKTHKCIFIKGNHDAWCEQWLANNIIQERWFNNGGEATIKSYSNIPSEKKTEHINFFSTLVNYYTDDKKRLFIHAGFAHTKGPRFDRFDADSNWDKTLWETAVSMDKSIAYDSVFYPKRLKLFREVFIGHTLTTDYGFTIPMQGTNVWNIDTGAGFKGKLTIMDAGTKEFWQSDFVAELYPNEKGRNGC
ncbi:MAG: metallophosphoesterase family protein [Bacteroidota bacterium]|nr:metallophosphoesterase family protein [Bacteroidota bacterium]